MIKYIENLSYDDSLKKKVKSLMLSKRHLRGDSNMVTKCSHMQKKFEDRELLKVIEKSIMRFSESN